MKERPILFSGEMVRAILDGRKTQTRRVKKVQAIPPVANFGACPYGKRGDRLWVRETWYCADPKREIEYPTSSDTDVFYRATEIHPEQIRWKPSIFMPRWASRITLELTDVRVQRVQEITLADIQAEGLRSRMQGNEGPMKWLLGNAFAQVWDKLNAKRGYSWESNPWVWALTFARVQS